MSSLRRHCRSTRISADAPRRPMTRARGPGIVRWPGGRRPVEPRRLRNAHPGSLGGVPDARDPGVLTRVLTVLVIAGVAVPVALLLLRGTSEAFVADRRPIRTIFLGDCAVCHGAEARGTSNGPSLVGSGAA